jgi:Cdc6-like AAA superfamily ATPase
MGNDVSKAVGVVPYNSTEIEIEERDREISRMDTQVRGRVRKSVKYNMKIVIRGDRGTGKTMLWRRFQGLNFLPTVSFRRIGTTAS